MIRDMAKTKITGGCCPDCGSVLVKSGWQRVNRKGDKKQIYLCTNCYKRTVNPRRRE